LQARFKILKDPVRLWYKDSLNDVMTACIILHNMIVEDQRDEVEGIDVVHDDVDYNEDALEESSISRYINVHTKIRDKYVHSQLRDDLVENL
jgi:hypothetical protein